MRMILHTCRDLRGRDRTSGWRGNQTAGTDLDRFDLQEGTANQNYFYQSGLKTYLVTCGVIFGRPKEATHALRSRCLSSLDKASISPPCHTGGFRDSQSKPSSSRLGTPNFSSWSSCNGVVELPSIWKGHMSWMYNEIKEDDPAM